MILLEERKTEFGTIRIMRACGSGDCTYYFNGNAQSEINAEGQSTCAYIHVMAALIKQSGAQNVLMLGCGGGTLATLLHKEDIHVTVVDIDPHAFTLAQNYFHMPEEITCIVQDGINYLYQSQEHYDAVAIDVFGGDGSVPEKFLQVEFFQSVKKALTSSGIVVMNVLVKDQQDRIADMLAEHMESERLPVTLFDWENGADRNVIIAGGNIHPMHAIHNQPEFIRRKLKNIAYRTL